MAFVRFRQSPPALFGLFRFMAGSTYSVPDRLVAKYVRLQGVAQEVGADEDEGEVSDLPQGFEEHWNDLYGEAEKSASPKAEVSVPPKPEPEPEIVEAAATDDEAVPLGSTHPDNAPFAIQHKSGPWFSVVNVLGDVVSTSSLRKMEAQKLADALNAGQVDSEISE